MGRKPRKSKSWKKHKTRRAKKKGLFNKVGGAVHQVWEQAKK